MITPKCCQNVHLSVSVDLYSQSSQVIYRTVCMFSIQSSEETDVLLKQSTCHISYIHLEKTWGWGWGLRGGGNCHEALYVTYSNAHSPLWPIVGKLIQMGENLRRVKFSSKGMLDYEHWKECMECKITLKWFNNLIRSLKGNLLDLKPCWLCFKHPMTYISVPKTQPAMMHKTLLSLSVDSLPGPDQNSP